MSGASRGVQVQRGWVKTHRVIGGHAGLPMEALEVVGYRADHVVRVVDQVDPAIGVEIHRVMDPARRHELRQSHGAGVAALLRPGIGAGALVQHQELLQFGLEVSAALLRPRMSFWEVKGERGKCIEHAIASCLLAVKGFHADDADDDFSRNAVFLFGPFQCDRVLLPKANAGLDARRLHEALAVGAPVLRNTARRRRNQSDDRRDVTGLADDFVHPASIQATTLRHVGDLGHHVGAARIGRARHRGGRGWVLLLGGGGAGTARAGQGKRERQAQRAEHSHVKDQESWRNSRRSWASARRACAPSVRA